jgi:hypothetical protein
MNTTTERQERRSALDEFAQKTVPQATDIATVIAAAPPDAIYGSREVAARRDNRLVLNEIRELAAAAGQDWYYRFPVKNKKTNSTDWIEGPTIELALDVARAYGNCHVDCRAQDLGNVILFHARFHDVEKGFSMTRPFQQRKGASRLGGADEGRRDEIDFQIGASKAIRNVILNGLRTYTNFGFEEAKEALVDKIGGQIERYRRTTVERIEKLVPLPRVEAVIGRNAAEWLAPDIARVIAMGKAIADGMASVDETFPPLGHEVRHDRDTGEVLDQFVASERDMVNQSSGGSSPVAAGKAAVSPAPSKPPNEPEAAVTGIHPKDIKFDIIDGVLKAAVDDNLDTPQERLEGLDILAAMLEASYPDQIDFIGKAVRLAAKVPLGETTVEDAHKYLEAIAQSP